ncbi:CoB--CoM heterodisulfide reductase iron-sulfur subunit B family protein [bacterium]|nr:CoB--CoM heterodisulfide reductase iron-sulfur subunit B family protein [bacterium]
MNYAYYPGCSLESTSPDFNISTEALIEFLSLDIPEVDDWVCCGASSLHPEDKLASLALPALTIESAEKQKRDIMVQCPACYAHLRESQEALTHEGTMQDNLKEAIGREISAKLKIKHFSEILMQEIGLEALQAKVTKPLKDIKIANYYGCVIVRPQELMQYDDPEDPQLMDKLVNITGAESVSWPFKTKCCGAGNSISKTEVTLDMTYQILSMAKKNGADAISVLCPLCHINLDFRQPQIERRYKEKFNLPVFYYTQLLGLAFGLDPKKLALDRLFVSPFPLLKSKGILS